MRITSKILVAGAAVISLAACADNSAESEADKIAAEEAAAKAAEPVSIVGAAQRDENFSTLVTALAVADLGSTLAEEGPYTVFGPTNAAFNKVDQTKLSELLTAEKKDELTAVLSYHVVAGKMTAADIAKAIAEGEGTATLKTLQGGALTASLAGNKVILEDEAGKKSSVVVADVEATNGVIHGIDTVVHL
ncbi:fasciclin domain-containing protein [Parasphingorhabdus sp. JC815]|uniref:fasciclin domain-containing protein n=1 Tax=Parasphingorhabdus sp. JC815 TaxID=3232140 RepID=UPI00345A139C